MSEPSQAVLSLVGATLAFDAASGHDPAQPALTRLVVAREVCAAGSVFRHDSLATLAILLTHRGRAEVTHCGQEEAMPAGRRVLHQPNRLVVMRPGACVEERVAPDMPWDVSYLLISGNWAQWCAGKMPAGVIAIPAPSQRHSALFDSLLETVSEGAENPWPVLAAVAELLGTVTAGIAGTRADSDLETQVARLIDNDPAAMLGRSQIAQALRLTTRALAHRFQKETGYPLALWLRRHRVQKAQNLLSQGRTVSEVADALGFANPFHFSRVFKRMTGQSPSEVRAQAFQEYLHS